MKAFRTTILLIMISIWPGQGTVYFNLFSDAHAQWSGESPITMHRGLMGHSVFNLGMTGRRDNGRKQELSSFSYPMGRSGKVRSNGHFRSSWNPKSNSGGEGFWVMSRTEGIAHVSAAGSEVLSSDIQGLNHDPSAWPEAYVGVVHDEDYALANRKRNGSQALQTDGVDLGWAVTNWWPSSGEIAAGPVPISRRPVGMWNFRYGRYNSARSYGDRIQDGEFARSGAPAWVEQLSEDEFPEVLAISKANSSETGLQWTRKWYQWGHADYDDLLINETVVENTSPTTHEGVYLVYQNRFWQQQAGAWREEGGGRDRHGVTREWSRDNHARSTVASNYLDGVSREAFLAGAGKPAGLSLGRDLAEQGHALLYAHDGESLHITNLIPDVGDPYRHALGIQRFRIEHPWINEGFLNQSQYFGIGVIDGLPPFNTYGGTDPDIYVAPRDNPVTELDESRQQPASVTIWRFTSHTNFTHPSPLKNDDAFLYDALTTAGYHAEPEEPFAYSHFVTFGPYDLQPGEKCKVVVAYVGGQGASDPKFSDYKRYAQPFNFGWMNLFGGTGQADVRFEERQKEIPLGEDTMFRHFQRAIDAYNWGYDLPNQPPSIKLSFKSNLDGQTEILWSALGEDSPDPDYVGEEAVDLRGYRIYRSTIENQGPWEFVSEFSFEGARTGNLPPGVTFDPSGVFHTVPTTLIPSGIPLKENKYVSGLDALGGADISGLYTFVDRNSKAGFPAWYSVRYYDSGHDDWNGRGTAILPLESAAGPSGSAIIGATTGIVPVIPSDAIFNRFEAKIRIVPNPYRAGDPLHSYANTTNLRIINLPSRCRIQIFDVSGTLAFQWDFENLNQGEYTWKEQWTWSGPFAMFPGIYFWRITSLMPESMGKVQKGTLLVIK